MLTQINPRMFDFQKLEVYIKAREFHISCKAILSKTKYERYVKDQLSRASYSVVLNIAEGSAKQTKPDRKNFFTTSSINNDSIVNAINELARRTVLIYDENGTLLN